MKDEKLGTAFRQDQEAQLQKLERDAWFIFVSKDKDGKTKAMRTLHYELLLDFERILEEEVREW